MTSSAISGSGLSANINYQYDAVGNMKSKFDYSTTSSSAYQYVSGTNRLNSVALKDGITTETFGYDSKGNQTERNGNTEVVYNVFNKPTYINRLGSQVSLFYDANWSRYRQTREVDGTTITTHYIDKLYEVEFEAGNAKASSYISDVAILIEDQNSAKIRFTHKDRLGSSATFTDHNGNVTAYRSYDPFGKPKMGNGGLMSSFGVRARLANNLTDTDMATRRGFTDHEHLDEVEIIHMNGRVYDYNVGRFMGVDPFIQEAWNSQSINPYSYILNNPLWGTDPSGYSRIRGISGSNFGGKAYGYWDSGRKAKSKDDNGVSHLATFISKGVGQDIIDWSEEARESIGSKPRDAKGSRKTNSGNRSTNGNQFSGTPSAVGATESEGYIKQEQTFKFGDNELSYTSEGPKGFAEKLTKDLGAIAETDAGEKMLIGLIDSDSSILIKYSRQPFEGVAKGYDTAVGYNHISGPGIHANVRGRFITNEPSFLSLAHELHHSWASTTGRFLRWPWQAPNDSVRIGGSVRGLSNSETFAVRHTNLIRQQAGLKYRRTHYLQEGNLYYVD